MGFSDLNQQALSLVEQTIDQRAELGVEVREVAGARIVDFGSQAKGGLAAGIRLAEICVSGLATIQLAPGRDEVLSGPQVCVRTDHPLTACMGSQYAGWPVSVPYRNSAGEERKFFAMGSGPMRAVRGEEKVLTEHELTESAQHVVGVLETRKPPPPAAIEAMAETCGVAPERLTLAMAPTASIAGSLQVVARSVETALHKLHELGFDLKRIHSGFGAAPLPPIAKNDLAGIGRTNDAVLYGGEVTLWVDGDDDSISSIGPQTPSSSSSDHGEPFGDLFKRYDYDFYRVDPMLFSPAIIRFCNIDTGRSRQFGELRPDILYRSFTH